MAVVVFSKAAGQVSSFVDPTLPARVTLRIEDWGGFLGFKSIISRVTVSARGNFQFLHTLGGKVFVYVFGERIGQLGISGLSFDSICGDEAGTLGIERVLNYYADNRIAARATPVKVTIGTATTLSAYLVGITGDVVDPRSRIWQFNMDLALVPQDDDDDEADEADEAFDAEIAADDDIVDPGQDGGGIYTTFPPVPGYVSDRGGADLSPTISAAATASGYAAVGSGPSLSMVRAVQ